MAKGDRMELFNVIERDGMSKPYWQKIGAAFENADGSFSLIFDSFPAGTGRVQMRHPYVEPAEEKPAEPAQDAGRRPRTSQRR